LKEAQEVMPEYRRRPLSASNVWKFGEEVKEFLQEKRAAFSIEVAPIRTAEERAERAAELTTLEASINPDVPSAGGKRLLQLADAIEAYDQRVVEAAQRIAAETERRLAPPEAQPETPPAQPPTLLGLLTAALDSAEGRALIGVVTSAVMQHLWDIPIAPSAPVAVPEPAPTIDPEPLPDPAPEARVRLPRVLIVGLLPAQIQVIKNKYRERFDLRFAHQDIALRELRGMVPGVERVVIQTSWISHKAEDIVRSNLADGAQFQRVTGGVSAIMRALDD
jgi:hypothetical protein